MIARIACFFCALALFFACASAARGDTQVRILLLKHQLQTVIASADGMIVRPSQGSSPLLTPDVTTVVDILPRADGLLIAGAIQAGDQILITPLGALGITIDGQLYRGSVIVSREAGGTLAVINVLELEQYLYSVVGSEVSASTPPSALQAQAVVARTYAVSRIGSHEDLGFDLRAGDQDQAYNGIDAESVPVVDAVDATRGVVMIYRNHLAQAYYSACDGGFTSGGQGLNDPQPYLQAVRDPYCPLSPYMQWSAAIDSASFVDALNARGINGEPRPAGGLRDVQPGAYDSSGRLQSVELTVAYGRVMRHISIPGTVFRVLAGTKVIKSTRIASLSFDGGVIHARGAGFGHGVGMCQLGARGMAESGLGVYAIINFYYSGVLLTQLASFQRFQLAHAAAARLAAKR